MKGLCKDCVWARHEVISAPDPAWVEFYERLAKDPTWTPPRMWNCHHPTSRMAAEPDYVTGQERPPLALHCSTARASAFEERCDPAGRCWMPFGFFRSDDDEDFVGFGSAP